MLTKSLQLTWILSFSLSFFFFSHNPSHLFHLSSFVTPPSRFGLICFKLLLRPVGLGDDVIVVHPSRSAYSIHTSSPFKRALMLCSGANLAKSKSEVLVVCQVIMRSLIRTNVFKQSGSLIMLYCLATSQFNQDFQATIHFPLTSAVHESQQHKNKLSWTRGCWVRSENATPVLCSPTTSKQLCFAQGQKLTHASTHRRSYHFRVSLLGTPWPFQWDSDNRMCWKLL